MVRLSYKQLGEIARSRTVRRRLDEVAEGIAGRARTIVIAEGIADQVDIGVTRGTRPKGRPFARVTMSPDDVEHGTSSVPRRRVLGRAASDR